MDARNRPQATISQLPRAKGHPKMAIAQPGPIVASISGSIAGATFRSVAGRMIISTKQRGHTVPTTKRLSQRGRFQTIQDAWAALTDEQRLAWRTVAIGLNQAAHPNSRHNRSGREVYFQYALPWVGITDLANIATPPTETTPTPASMVLDVRPDGAPNPVKWTYAPYNAIADTWLWTLASQPYTVAPRSKFASPLLVGPVEMTVSGTSTQTSIATAWDEVFSSRTAAQPYNGTGRIATIGKWPTSPFAYARTIA